MGTVSTTNEPHPHSSLVILPNKYSCTFVATACKCNGHRTTASNSFLSLSVSVGVFEHALMYARTAVAASLIVIYNFG